MAFYKFVHARVIVLTSLVCAFVYYQAKEAPVLTPSVDVPDLTPSVDVLDLTPSVDVPDLTPSVDVPDLTPSVDVPNLTPSVDVPDLTPSVDVPNLTPSVNVPDLTPSVDVPDLTPSVEVPILSPSVAVPVIENELLASKLQGSPSTQQEIIRQESGNASQGEEHKSGDAGNSEVEAASPRSTGVTVIKDQRWEFPVLDPSGGAFLKKLDFSGYKLKDRRFMEARRKLMLRRAGILRKVCNSRERLAKSSVLLHLVWDTRHTPNVIWCPVYKVASTSWMVNFLRLAHFNENNTDLADLPAKLKEKKQFKPKYGATQSQVYELYPPPEDPEVRTRVFKNSVRALVVRHPYSRLISAYRDKMLKLDPLPEDHHFRDLQLHIIARYRKNRTETSPFPTFPEFVQYVIDSTRGLNTRDEWISKVKCWTPYWAQCNVCASDYNVVLKLETIQKDERFLITLANMTELKKLKSPEWRHLQDGTPSDDLVDKYFKQLNLYQIKQLHSRYLLDFLLFGYHQEKQLLKNARE